MTQVSNIRSPTTEYHIEKLMTKSDAPRKIFLVTDVADGAWYLMKVSPDIPGNGLLDREALILKDIGVEVKQIRSKEPKGTKHGGFRFEKCFPQLRESFSLSTQRGKQAINVIDLPAADLGYGSDLLPLEQVRTRKRAWIDPKSSAWIMGRLLKMFTLLHPIGVSVGQINAGNLLIRPGERDVRSHRALFFDWTQAHQYDHVVPSEKVGEEIAQAATMVFKALGGNVGTGMLPDNDQLLDDRYATLLLKLMSGRECDPDKARAYFYDVINDIWESAFHPFTTTPIKQGE